MILIVYIFSTATVKNAVWSLFVNIVRFLGTIAFLCFFSLLMLGFRFYSVSCVIMFFFSYSVLSSFLCMFFYVLHQLCIQ